jgi:hypothetical protein
MRGIQVKTNGVNDEEAQYLLQVRLNWQEEDPR